MLYAIVKFQLFAPWQILSGNAWTPIQQQLEATLNDIVKTKTASVAFLRLCCLMLTKTSLPESSLRRQHPLKLSSGCMATVSSRGNWSPLCCSSTLASSESSIWGVRVALVSLWFGKPPLDSVLNKCDTLWCLSCPCKISFKVQGTTPGLCYHKFPSMSTFSTFWHVTWACSFLMQYERYQWRKGFLFPIITAAEKSTKFRMESKSSWSVLRLSREIRVVLPAPFPFS